MMDERNCLDCWHHITCGNRRAITSMRHLPFAGEQALRLVVAAHCTQFKRPAPPRRMTIITTCLDGSILYDDVEAELRGDTICVTGIPRKEHPHDQHSPQ